MIFDVNKLPLQLYDPALFDPTLTLDHLKGGIYIRSVGWPILEIKFKS